MGIGRRVGTYLTVRSMLIDLAIDIPPKPVGTVSLGLYTIKKL